MQKDTLIESLENCITACNYCASSCLDEDNVQSMTECIKTDLDCATICNMALQLLVRDSNKTIKAVELCQDMCAQCAEECDKHNHDHCQKCAKACRRCEDQCRNYLSENV